MRWTLFCGLAALVALGFDVAFAQPAGVKLDTRWEASIDAQGKVTALALRSELQPRVAEPLASAIHGWSFEPARAGDPPAAVETTLYVTLRLEPTGGDSAIRVLDVRSGGAVERGSTPTMPSNVLRRSGDLVPALVVAQLQYDADGEVTSAELATGAPAADERLVKDALRAVRRWRFTPERVGGQARAASALVPICFRPPSDMRDGIELVCGDWTPPGARAGIAAGAVYVAEPAIAVRAGVIGSIL